MPTEATVELTDRYRIEHRYSWGGCMDHSEVIISCRTCGASWHSDFDDSPDPIHDTGECSRSSGTAARFCAGLVSVLGRACTARFELGHTIRSGWWFHFADDDVADDEPF